MKPRYCRLIHSSLLPASHSSCSSRSHQFDLRANPRRSILAAILLSGPYHIDVRISEIDRAARILKEMQRAHEAEIGAIGLDGLMIDAPMIKQVTVVESVLGCSNQSMLGAESY